MSKAQAAVPVNLQSLHQQEERIRTEALGLIGKDPALSDHLRLVHDAMDVLNATCLASFDPDKDELSVQLLGLRMFNGLAVGLKLGLSGYYQNALASLRDVLELTNLLDLFLEWSAKIAEWRQCDSKARSKKFGPAAVRKELDARDGWANSKREPIYKLYCEYAAHASQPGFRLVAPDGLAKIGPFLDEALLTAWLVDMAKHGGHGALVLSMHFADKEPLFKANARYLDQLRGWHTKYLAVKQG